MISTSSPSRLKRPSSLATNKARIVDGVHHRDSDFLQILPGTHGTTSTLEFQAVSTWSVWDFDSIGPAGSRRST